MDVPKTVQFLLENQAQFEARIERLEEEHSRQRELVGQLIGLLSQQASELRKFSRRTDQHLQALGDAQRKTEERVQVLADRIGVLDSKVDLLIKAVTTLTRRDGQQSSEIP